MRKFGIATLLIAALAPAGAAAQEDGAGPVLIAKGADWSYYTRTGEPKGDWKRGKGAKGWLIGKASIGYDKSDVVTEFPAFTEANAGAKGGEQHGDHTHAGAGSVIAEKYPAIYYRRTFEWDPKFASDGRQAMVHLRCDDACVAFVNGQEAARAHLPEGPIKSYATEGMMKSAFYPFAIPRNLLRNGKNDIAVVVYNSARDDHDHAFNAELTADAPTPAAP